MYLKRIQHCEPDFIDFIHFGVGFRFAQAFREQLPISVSVFEGTVHNIAWDMFMKAIFCRLCTTLGECKDTNP